MKELIQETLKVTLTTLSLLCMGASIVFPFCIGMKDTPYWIAYICYPVTFISIAHQNIQLKKKKL